ncbi:MAG: CBS domain-containing protein [Lentisphaeria bacterium]|nr:nucleotidyltransferase family protein [Lentisphaeria bacterium]NQZ70012.1 CBS domain-containing protein [Lentisphaeria bacterium]
MPQPYNRHERVAASLVPQDASLEIAITHMENEAALIVDDASRLVGMLTDGDLRRAFLKGASLQTSVHEIMSKNPITVSENTNQKAMYALMQSKQIRQLPVVDDEQRPVGLELLKDSYNHLHSEAVIMAGGKGSRLRPLTEHIPKPLLDFGDSTILETIMDGLKENGIDDIILTVNYLADKIRSHIGDGSSHDINVSYVEEEKQLGTAGALALIEKRPKDSFLVMNGDLITDLDFRSLKHFHRESKNDITVCVRRESFQIPYGVIRLNDDCKSIKELQEKPKENYLVNAGIYMMEPEIIDLIPKNKFYDMTSLIESCIEQKKTVGAFPILEYWQDIGRHTEMEKAKREWSSRRRKQGKKKPVY